MSEILEKQQFDRLELEHRNLLQRALLNVILGKDASRDDRAKWLVENGKKISDLIDYHEHDEIRNLARQGRYEEAAEKLLKFL